MISTKPPEDMSKTVKRLWPYLWPKNRLDLRYKFYFALALLLLAKVITALMPFTFKWTVDGLSNQPLPVFLPSVWAAPLVMVVLYGVMRIAMVGATQWRDGLFSEIAMSAVRKLSLKSFQHLHALSLRFHLERRTGGLSRVLDRGNKGIETIVRMTVFTFFPTILELVLMVGVLLFMFNWVYVGIMLGTIALYMLFTTQQTAKRMTIRKAMNESDTDAGTKAVDSLLNYETVKYFGNEGHEIARFDASIARYEKAAVKTYTSLGWLNFGQALIFTCGMAVMMMLCVWQVQQGAATVGDLVMVNAMMIQLYMPLNFMGTVYRETRQAFTDIEAMFDLLDQNPEVQDKQDAKPLLVKAGALEFKDIHFAYDAARPILKGVSFRIPAGQTFAVVGPSGAGKSTLSRLIFRFYEPSMGDIFIDEQNISDVTQKSLRQALGMVPQDTVLFNDTLGYNIRYGLWDASDEDVLRAAEQAQLGAFIASLPKGLDTEVGERGLKLSGGEKQRVAIARTLLKNPPILVLDEATSALDSFTEREIQQALDMISEQRTTLVIAHRLSTVVNADRILVLDGGVITEQGTHEQLLKRKGLYAGLWERQQREEKLREETNS